MFLVGLTGSIGTGKSTVSTAFRKYGCAIIEADIIAREVVEPGCIAWKKIREAFGDDVFLPDGHINRERLGQIVFTDSSKREILNRITHPEIYKAIVLKIVCYFFRGYQFVLLDLPLLYESGKMLPFMSFIIVVSCTDYQQRQRIHQRDGFSAEVIENRIRSQMSLAEKCHRANYIIDNSGTVEMTESQVLELVKKFRQSRAHWPIRILVLIFLFGMLGIMWKIWF